MNRKRNVFIGATFVAALVGLSIGQGLLQQAATAPQPPTRTAAQSAAWYLPLLSVLISRIYPLRWM